MRQCIDAALRERCLAVGKVVLAKSIRVLWYLFDDAVEVSKLGLE
jgi:hypothetical protein